MNDKKLPEPNEDDWLFQRTELGQTLKEYVNSYPVTPTDSQKVIYLQPIGTFDSTQNENINFTAEYLRRFFELKTVILETIHDDIIPDSARRIGPQDNEQLLATYILHHMLKTNMADDAIGVMAITEKDLYPKPSWNYVFGLSSLRDRVSVSSMYRFQDSEDYRVCLNRLIKVSSHEVSHMFSMKHCINAVCLMNGSNHLGEADKRPNRLCAVCLAKLNWSLGLTKLERLEAVSDFFSTHELKSDFEKLQADIMLLKKTVYPYQD